jgi:hypothetical protein
MSKLELIDVKDGRRWPLDHLRKTLKSPVWVVRFAKAFDLNAAELGHLMRLLFPNDDLVKALLLEGGSHSASLQDYLVGLGYDSELFPGTPGCEPSPEPENDMLVEMFSALEVKIANDLDAVVAEVRDVLYNEPGKQGRMALKSLMKFDRKRRTLGVHEAGILHAHTAPNLVVLDVSGSMTEATISRIVDAVVSLALRADAWLAIVSDTTHVWEPGMFSVSSVMECAEFGGTRYETLSPLLDRDWNTVVTIADYDSSYAALAAVEQCRGRIARVLDISLVNRPTFLAEVLGRLADEVRPLMVAKSAMTYDY